MSESPVTIVVTLQPKRSGDVDARIVGWAVSGGRYGSLWSRSLPRVGHSSDSPASLLAGLVASLSDVLAKG